MRGGVLFFFFVLPLALGQVTNSSIASHNRVFVTYDPLHQGFDVSCKSDADCLSYNAKCSDGSGAFLDRFCVCSLGYFFDYYISGKCTSNVDDFTAVLGVAPLYFSEQKDLNPDTQLQNGRVALPQNWICSQSLGSCQTMTTPGGTLLQTSNTAAIFALLSQESYIPSTDIYWKCNDTRAPVVQLFSSAVDPTSVFGGLSPDAYCVPIANVCQGVGSTWNASAGCVCSPGSSGDRCEVQSQNPFLSVIPAGKSCQSDADCNTPREACFMNGANFESKTCQCAFGYFPTAASCAQFQSRTTNGVLWESTVFNRISIADSTLDLYPTWASLQSSLIHATLQSFTQLATPLTAAESSPVFWRCANTSTYFKDVRVVGAGGVSSGAHCLGCSAVCGPGANCATSDPISGTCSCLSSWTGPNCASCAHNMTGPNCDMSQSDCRTQRCSGTGSCVDASPKCHCDPGWYGDKCEKPISNCTADVCGGSQYVNARCLVDTYGTPRDRCICTSSPPTFGRFCNTSESECSKKRCNGNGECLFDTLQQCACVPWFNGDPWCGTSVCVNGGVYNSTLGKCVCPSDTFGTWCQNKYCGLGTYDNITGTCDCDLPSGVLSLDPRTRNCTANTCGPGGVPSKNYDRCVCSGNRIDYPNLNPRCRTPTEKVVAFTSSTGSSAPSAKHESWCKSHKTECGLAIGFGVVGSAILAVVFIVLFCRWRRRYSGYKKVAKNK